MIHKPKYDIRSFSGGKLKNNIKYIHINDEHLDKSFISVCASRIHDNLNTFQACKSQFQLKTDFLLFWCDTRPCF